MKEFTPLKAIRAKCLDCSAGQPSEVRKCDIPECPLFTYRFGKNPKRKGIGKNKNLGGFSRNSPTQTKISTQTEHLPPNTC